jgi:hypothetical protein
MSDYISGSSPLILQAREAAARLELRGDSPELLAKIQNMLKLHGWNSGEQYRVTQLLERVAQL